MMRRLGGSRTLAVIWSAVSRASRMKLTMVAAGIAFYGMLALFPALAALIAIWSFFADPVLVQGQLQSWQEFMPAEVYAVIDQQLKKLVATGEDTLGWTSVVSILTALWSARMGVVALMEGLNTVFGRESRSALWQVLVGLFLTGLLITATLVALAAVVIAPILLALLPFGPMMSAVLSGVRWLISIFLIVGVLGLLYRFAPNHKPASRAWVTPGVGLAVVIWAAVSWLFSFYLSQFGSYNEIYGALGTVVALLMWLWLSALAVLIGAVLDAEVEKLRAGGAGQAPAEADDEGAVGTGGAGATERAGQ